MRLPPYGRKLYELRQANPQPIYNIYLYIGANAWRLAREHPEIYSDRRICLPPYVDPYEYDYPVKDCGILILGGHESDMDYINHVIISLFSQDAIAVTASVTYATTPTHRLLFFKKDFKNV